MNLDYCVLCSKVKDDPKQDCQAWRLEHDQKEHPTYYAVQVGLID